MTRLSNLESLFHQLGVDCGKPGFYDDAGFVHAEKTNPELLDVYAEYVMVRDFSPEYLATARQMVRQTSDYLFRKLVEDGRKGACIDASMTLSRFLEKQGIWNFAVRGGLTIEFSKETGLESLHFCPIMEHSNPAKAGHVWVHAPPFPVVDLTVALQPYRGGQGQYLQGAVVAEDVGRGSVEWPDLFDPDCVPSFVVSRGRLPTLPDMEAMSPGLLARIQRLGVYTVRLHHATLKYVTCAVTAPDSPLEAMTSLRLKGFYPKDLYADYVKSCETTLGRDDAHA